MVPCDYVGKEATEPWEDRLRVLSPRRAVIHVTRTGLRWSQGL